MSIFKRNKTFYIWLFSYLLIFSIPFIFSIVSYILSEQLIRYESLYHKRAIQTEMKDLVDFRFAEIDKLTNQIIWDREIRFYLKMSEPNGDFRDSLEKKFKELRFLNTYIDQIYIVNENTSSEMRIFPQNFQSSTIDWEQISGNKERPFLYEDIDRSHEGKELCTITRFFMVDERDSGIYLVVLINPKLLDDTFSQIEWIDKGAGIVVDDRGTILSSRVNIEIDSSLAGELDDLLNRYENSGEYIEIRRDNLAISVLKSDFLDLYFIIITPEEVYYGKIRRFQTLAIAVLIICLSAGIYLSWTFSRKRYLPILSLVNLFGNDRVNRLYLDYTNEFEILETEIKSVIKENRNVKETFDKNKLGLKRLFLRRLVIGEEIESSIVLDIGSSIGIDFPHEYFCVLIIDPVEEGSTGFLNLKKEIDLEMEVIENEFNCYLFVYSGKFVGILNIDTMTEYSILTEQLGTIADYLRKRITSKFIVTAGKIYYSLSGISISYSEALQVLEYRNLLGQKDIHLFTELKELEQNRKFQYLSYLEDEYKIYNLLTAGKYDDANVLLKKNIETIEESYVDVEILKIRLAGFKNILIESLNTIFRNDDAHLKKYVKIVISSKSFHQFKNNVDVLLVQLEEISPEKTRSDLVSNAKEYIEKNFNDKNISVALIAEKLGITPQHLSKIFKEIKGTGPLQYINNCRIEEAKKILVNEPEINIKDTTNIVGYYNEITFIRNFKNSTGLSPGKYRKIMTGHAEVQD